MSRRLAPERAARLLDAYGALLTDRQREAMALVYEQDWSLAEVAAWYGVSRAAVSDLLERAGQQLLQWDDQLGLLAHAEATHAALRQLRAALEELPAGRARWRAAWVWRSLVRLESRVDRV
jgi:predicted DNA-binding protein YlxM (UPF0122 family)